MASNDDTGHAKNVSNFGIELNRITEIGNDYKPSGTLITLNAMQYKYDSAVAVMAETKAAKDAYARFCGERAEIFDKVRPLATNVIGELKNCEAPVYVIDNAISVQRKFQGRRAKPREKPTEEEIAAGEALLRSVSQQSFDNLVDHMDSLLIVLKAEPKYQPNEPDLMIPALDDFYERMKASNANVITATSDYIKAMAKREEILYADKTGLYDMALAARGYVRRKFKAYSVQYKQLQGLKFVKLIRKKRKKK